MKVSMNQQNNEKFQSHDMLMFTALLPAHNSILNHVIEDSISEKKMFPSILGWCDGTGEGAGNWITMPTWRGKSTKLHFCRWYSRVFARSCVTQCQNMLANWTESCAVVNWKILSCVKLPALNVAISHSHLILIPLWNSFVNLIKYFPARLEARKIYEIFSIDLRFKFKSRKSDFFL